MRVARAPTALTWSNDPSHCNPARNERSFLYGYLSKGFELKALIAKYSADPADTFARSSALWKNRGVHFTTPQERWVEREISWHNYYLRSALTWDSFFRKPILSRAASINMYMDSRVRRESASTHSAFHFLRACHCAGYHSLHTQGNPTRWLASLWNCG